MNSDQSYGSEYETSIPSLYPFITFRQERFGGMVFNPYFGIEEELNLIEAYSVALCNGHNSERQVVNAIRNRFGFTWPQAQNRYDSIKQRLLSAMAICLDKGKEQERPHLPDIAVFLGDGPYYHTPKDVIWDLTYACNLQCSHCLTSSGKSRHRELDTQQAFTLINRLSTAKILRVSLSGGEPFLRPDIVDIIRRITDENMRVDIATNGFELSDDMLIRLRDLPLFQVQVSIDGTEEQHDLMRGVAGAFARSCETVRRLRSEGLAVAISMTVTAENLQSLERVIDIALELDCSGFKAISFMPAGRGKYHRRRFQLNPAGQHEFASVITRRSKELKGILNITTETTFSHLLKQQPLNANQNGSMGCSAGYDTLSIGAKGTVYPCPFLHNFPLGNLLKRPLDYIWYESQTLRILRTITKQNMSEPCHSCTYAPQFCRGGCRAAAYLAYGDLLAADPNCFKGQLYKDIVDPIRVQTA